MNDVTIAMTIGRRPKLLEKTLASLSHILPHYLVLAVNDFGRDAASEVFKTLCPHGELHDLPLPLGHHGALDVIYAKIETEFVFQCEDDWLFTKDDFVTIACTALKEQSTLSTICFRQLSDQPEVFQKSPHLERVETDTLNYYSLVKAHRDWHGYTFNPHITRHAVWKDYGPFQRYRKERHISKKCRKNRLFVAYADPGFCRHIGYDETVTSPHPNLWQRLRSKIHI